LKGDISASICVTPADSIRDKLVTGVQTSALPISSINATALANDHVLTVSGTDNTAVTGLTGDLDATGLSGTLSVSLVDNTADQEIGRASCRERGKITGSAVAAAAEDTVKVDAHKL